MISTFDRYQRVGLRRNPFAFEALSDAASFVDRGLGTPTLAPATLVQVIGDKGWGKTTQLKAWRSDIEGPYHYVGPERTSRWARPPIARVVFADEVDRMARPVRARWFRQIAETQSSLIIGTHVDLGGCAQRAGLHPVSHELSGVDLASLEAIAARRISAAALPGVSPTLEVTAEDVRRVHAECLGSIRVAETLLHALVAERVGASAPRSV